MAKEPVKKIRIECEGAGKIAIDKCIEFQGNLKELSDENYQRGRNSILELGFSFPLHLWKQKNKVYIIDAHQRVKICKRMRDNEGYTIPELPFNWVFAKDREEAAKKVLAATSQYGTITAGGFQDFIKEHDIKMDFITQTFNFPELKLIDVAKVNLPGKDDAYPDGEAGALANTYIAPPFSVLDTRQGYWKDRKTKWRDEIEDQGESREGTLSKTDNSLLANLNEGVSILDPVLAEIMLKWFSTPGWRVLDPFAGDTIFGYVAKKTGHLFTGIELRKEQADLNQHRCDKLMGSGVGEAKYICDTSANLDKYVKPESMDFLFSCPPYFDLEVYSDSPEDLSNQNDYRAFYNLLSGILINSARKLRKNRFACIVMSDVRDKEGQYLQIVADIIKFMTKDAGLKFYNDLVLVNSAGTAPLRAGRSMGTRKVVRLHQNVLVFYKGDISQIKAVFPKLTPEELEDAPLPIKD